MDKTTDTGIGEFCPIGHPSGRIMFPPTSAKQAKLRVAHQLRHFEDACRDAIDANYARECLDEAVDDFCEFTAGLA